ncbi:MAG: LysM peptidoglycan-binding domain-containing protein [Thermodesulfobacteriota bacterium]
MSRLTVIFMFLAALTLTACGVSESEYNEMAAQRDALKTQLEEAQKENQVLNEAIVEIYKERETLKKQVTECRGRLETQSASGTPATQPSDQEEFYVVQPGDTLGYISQITGVSIDTLRQLNADSLGPWLMPGQKIRIK